MGLNSTPSAERVHIGIFGKRNAGKSSIINAITDQSLAIVSDVKGTTTDPVSKAMELLPLGPVVVIDTPGIDDEGELGKLNAHIEEAYSGMNVIKAYNAEVVFEEKFDDLNNRVYKANFISQFLSGLMPPMMQFIGNLGYVAVCIVGAVLATKGVISFGTIIAFIIYFVVPVFYQISTVLIMRGCLIMGDLSLFFV